LDMKQAAGLSIVLVFVSALSGAIAHRKRSSVCPDCMRLLAPAAALITVMAARMWFDVVF